MVNIFNNPVYILIIIVNIVIIAAIILTLFEAKLRRKAESTENSQEKVYTEDLNLLKKSNQTPEAKLYALNGVAKSFFQTTYNLNSNKTYSELSKDFKKLGNKKAIKFSEKMLISYYTKEKLSEKETIPLIDQLVFLIEESIKKPVRKLPEEQSQITKTLEKIKSIFDNKKEQGIEYNESPSSKKDKSNEQITKTDLNKNSEIQKEKSVKTSHELLKEKRKERLLQKLKSISQNQIKINELIQEVYDSNGIQLIEKNPNSESELYEVFQENPKVYRKFQEISELIQKNNKTFSSLFNHVYAYSQKPEKKLLNNLIENWKREQETNLTKYKNPLKMQIKESELMYKYFMELNSITKNLINKKEAL